MNSSSDDAAGGSAAPAPLRPVRPAWVYIVVGVYAILVVTITFGPVVVGLFSGDLGGFGAVLLYATALFVCGGSLVFVPIRAARRRPSTRRSIWFPIVGSATLAAFLFAGLGLAAHEFAFGNGKDGADTAFWALLAALPAVWFGWVMLFGVLAVRMAPEPLADRLYQSLLAGSVLELLVALSMHLVVRQRGYCCAGIGTGLGIGIGLLVMIVALGPAVVFLYYRRYRQVYARPDESNERGA